MLFERSSTMFDFIISLAKIVLFCIGGYIVLRFVAKKYAPEKLEEFENGARKVINKSASKVKDLTCDNPVTRKVSEVGSTACGHDSTAGVAVIDTSPRDVAGHVAKAGRGTVKAIRTFVTSWGSDKEEAATK
jgi:predicted RNA-binding protein YlqC (UPF0109 family)